MTAPKHISADERDRLIQQYSGIPTSVVWKYRKTVFACKMDYDDALGYACLGLVRAANFFNPAINENFMTVAYICCCRALCHEITKHFRYRNKNRSLESLTEWNVWWHNRRRPMRVSRESVGNPPVIGRMLRDRKFLAAENIEPKSKESTNLVDELDEFQGVVRFINTRVPKAHRDMAVMRFVKGMKLSDIGEVYGLTRERVRQITSKIKERLLDWKKQQDEGTRHEDDHSEDDC